MKVKKILKRTAYVLICLIVLFAVAWFTMDKSADSRYKKANAKWEKITGQSLDAFLKAHPATTENESAKALATIAADLGLKAGPNEDKWKKVKIGLMDYQKEVLEGDNGEAVPPPDDVMSYLEENAASLEKLRVLLGHAPVPVWEWNPNDIVNGKIPELLTILMLQRILTVDAFWGLNQGDSDRFMMDAEAGWQLNQALWDRPEMISKMVAIACDRFWAGALRKIPNPPQEWIVRFEDSHPAKTLAESVELQACSAIQLTDGPEHWYQYNDLSFVRRVSFAAIRPYLRMCVENYLLILPDMLKELEKTSGCSEFPAAAMQKLKQKAPKWDLYTREALPNLEAPWQRAWRLKLDSEFTARILKVKAERTANGGGWPEVVPGVEDSASCPDGKFKYSVSEGKMALEYSGVEPGKETHAAYLPLQYSE